ncbi:aryl-sulfate sulfotransferase [bacterium]|nr:aryl-sulfate sulfotransferase [bacterium]
MKRRFSSILSLLFFLLTAIGVLALVEERGEGEISPRKERRLQEQSSLARAVRVVLSKGAAIEEGYTLIPLSGPEKIILIDNSGTVLHEWKLDAARARLLPNGNLLVIHGSSWGKEHHPWKELTQSVREYSWEGELVWEYESPSLVHHDLARLPNGNTLFLNRAVLQVPPPSSPQLRERLGGLPRRIRSDRIFEVSKSGELLWQWHAHNFLDVYRCGARRCGGLHEKKAIRGQLIDWTHTNTLTVLPENQWHENGDSRFTPGNLLILPRNFWQALLIEKSSGKIVWRYPREVTAVPLEGDRFVRGHEVHMIPPEYPGAGHILVFDNGLDGVREYSILREIHPVTLQTVWRYEDREHFYVPAGGSLQRLPNGNTFVSQDRGEGRVFEVSPEGEVVWDVVLPYEPVRAHKYPPSYCPQFGTL